MPHIKNQLFHVRHSDRNGECLTIIIAIDIDKAAQKYAALHDEDAIWNEDEIIEIEIWRADSFRPKEMTPFRLKKELHPVYKEIFHAPKKRHMEG